MRTPKVLIACEESQRVCIAMREIGVEAYSCDLLPCSGSHQEWHVISNVLPFLNGFCVIETMDGQRHQINQRWDMIIAFPPCTKTSNAGAKHLYKGHKLNIPRYYEGLCGKALFLAIWATDCDKVVIENPVPSAVFNFPKPTQIIQPYEHGDALSKKTLLWERGVPLLKPSKVVTPKSNCHDAGTWFMKGGKERQQNRAKTHPGVAKAMADQWGKLLWREYNEKDTYTI